MKKLLSFIALLAMLKSVSQTCPLITHGDFENNHNCGVLASFATTDWELLAGTPDMYYRYCSASIFAVGNTIFFNTTPVDSHDGAPNDEFMGLFSPGSSHTEALQASLSSPLVAGQQYVLSFWVRTANTSSSSTKMDFSSYPSPLTPSFTNVSLPFTSLEPASIMIVPTTTVPNDNAWHYYSIPFTFPTGTPNHNYISVYHDFSSSAYMYVDDIKLLTAAQAGSLVFPDICETEEIADVNDYLGDLVSGGDWFGDGLYYFDPDMHFVGSAVGAGIHTIYYRPPGCTEMISAEINVLECCPDHIVLNQPEFIPYLNLHAGIDITTGSDPVTPSDFFTTYSGNIIRLKAGTEIVMKNQTWLKKYSDVLAQIEACTETTGKQTSTNPKSDDDTIAMPKSGVLIYPNPTVGKFTIVPTNITVTKILISSLEGKPLYSENHVFDAIRELDISNYEKGIYVLRIETADGAVSIQKIIKK